MHARLVEDAYTRRLEAPSRKVEKYRNMYRELEETEYKETFTKTSTTQWQGKRICDADDPVAAAGAAYLEQTAAHLEKTAKAKQKWIDAKKSYEKKVRGQVRDLALLKRFSKEAQHKVSMDAKTKAAALRLAAKASSSSESAVADAFVALIAAVGPDVRANVHERIAAAAVP